MKSEAKTVEEYISELPDDRATQIAQVRKIILANLPHGYEETMNWGMITYQVPLSVFPDTYNKQPLMYAALASQKNHMSVYLSGIYTFEDRQKRFHEAYKETGKRMDIGKSCVRFRKLDDLPLELIGQTIASLPSSDFVQYVKHVHSTSKRRKD
ncbi:MAG: DUF1801 domain-containing protein [Candidatus Marinimicrobia bacterium]|jgi:uncharacterized protein YdhG (YjbR/CyaY superfamily)|nr:DUF1801 domain-containing protein [Candidatus Neomarinimicrobiota bacterium]MBT3631060.1 DUF1801 domain-containing protein [Candidatus Neomarinimicrobiota bacterium]MBT3825700.1 DUF1801 domain-containing protein [Candidatus Neomarinimicrobiota bacterium]MBT4130556.1 DUF1801 domain-containing protein [Candidatus Neomarinimicrobiota bacterium]MBT4296223.1 DUF1801 domain-containing protein [Candidatus Neomarinimicrobiota bacterium]